ncbi:hypothetical protein ACJMK2_044426 [Sinanodonta woodiana]|uniref:Uncharacterized protein n=1 Tax=Sinanodonta woodiana TaxID=1069815 RepID=A0ABD3W1E5_SINWO
MRSKQMSIVYFLSAVAVVHGFCSSSPLKQYFTDSNRIRFTCEISQGDMKLTVLPGSIVYTSDCLECSCNLDTGLRCCGFGHLAGVVVPPKGCKTIHDGCEVLMVDAIDDSLSCNDKIPVIEKINGTGHPDNGFGLERNQARFGRVTSKADVGAEFMNQLQKLISLLDNTSQWGWRRRIQSRPIMPISASIPGGIFYQNMLNRTLFEK